jgi:hypothetical protein
VPSRLGALAVVAPLCPGLQADMREDADRRGADPLLRAAWREPRDGNPRRLGRVHVPQRRRTGYGRSSTSGGETTFYGPGGNVTGRSSGPPPARPTFPGQGK